MGKLMWSIIGIALIACIIGVVVMTGGDDETEAPQEPEVTVPAEEVTNPELVPEDNLTVDEEVEEVIELEPKVAYSLEDIYLNEQIDTLLSDRDLNLYDTEVEFDEKDYDVEEVFYVNGSAAINGEDFEENAYLTFDEEDLFYRIDIDPILNLSEINSDETLELYFLGNPIVISEWVNDEITFTKGAEYSIYETESVTVEGKKVVLDYVLDGDEVCVLVGEESECIEEDESKKVDGLEIKVVDVMYTERTDRRSKAILRIGDEVEVEVADGEEYDEDSIWEWKIEDHSLGLVLVEDFTELDDREDYNALDVEDKLCLPEDYLCVVYGGLYEENVNEYNFELDDGLVVIEGSFLAGINDYDEIFLNLTSGAAYEDDDCNETTDLIDNSTGIFFGDSEIELKFNSTGIYFNNITINSSLSGMDVNGHPLVNEEDNYRNEYGIVVYGPEDSLEDNEVKVSVPEERLEAIVSIF